MTVTFANPNLCDLDGRHFEVLVIGGGINGAGVLRELALNGVSALLVERGDICSGASSAPSRLIHGGLRYLENGEFRLVKESTTERNLLLKNAPHYVKPLETTIPAQSWMSGLIPAALQFFGLRAQNGGRGVLILKIGLVLYDWLGRRNKVMPGHYIMGRRKSAKCLPLLRSDIVGTATYFDARITMPERLCLEVITDGLSASDTCVARTYTRVVSVGKNGVGLEDQRTGEHCNVTADIICNATGAWIDTTNAAIGQGTTFIGGSKGSHVVLNNPELGSALDGRMIYFSTDDGRICLVYPIGENVLLGTTDILTDDVDDTVCTDEEVTYLLEALLDVMPTAGATPDQVVYRFCGVRPLPRSQAGTAGKVSRDHSIQKHIVQAHKPVPVFSLVGGKWTTFRAFAEQAGRDILQELGKKVLWNTRTMLIGGGDIAGMDASKISLRYGLPVELCEILLARYGNYSRLFSELARLPQVQPLTTLSQYFDAEIAYLAQHEFVEHLTDVIKRRTTIALDGNASPEVIVEIGKIVGEVKAWNTKRCTQEVNSTLAELRTINGQLERHPF